VLTVEALLRESFQLQFMTTLAWNFYFVGPLCGGPAPLAQPTPAQLTHPLPPRPRPCVLGGAGPRDTRSTDARSTDTRSPAPPHPAAEEPDLGAELFPKACPGREWALLPLVGAIWDGALLGPGVSRAPPRLFLPRATEALVGWSRGGSFAPATPTPSHTW
jgi:hypothetical protein